MTKVVVVNGGKFGERWTKICQTYGLKVTEIMVEWERPWSQRPADALKADPEIRGVSCRASRDLHNCPAIL